MKQRKTEWKEKSLDERSWKKEKEEEDEDDDEEEDKAEKNMRKR